MGGSISILQSTNLSVMLASEPGSTDVTPLYGYGRNVIRENWIGSWVTRVFISIVLLSAGIYLLSQFPSFQSPFWLGLVLQGFTFGSAYLFYASGDDETTG